MFGSLSVLFTLPDSHTFGIDIYPTTLVSNLKATISENHDLDQTFFDLVHEGLVLKPEENVMSAGIELGSEIDVVLSDKGMAVLRLPHGSATTTTDYRNCIVSGSTKMFDFIAAGFRINERFPDDKTPLYLCLKYGHTHLVKILLQHNDIDITNINSEVCTALHIVAKDGNTEILDILISDSRFAKLINETDDVGYTPLNIAAFKGKCDAVRLLLNCDLIDPNKPDAGNYTPLHNAVYSGHVSVVKVILQHPNVLIDVKNVSGETPIDVSRRRRFRELEEILSNKLQIDAVERYNSFCSSDECW